MKKLLKVIILLLVIIVKVNYVEALTLDCNDTLKRGSTGSNVEVLQKKLNEYMKCDLVVDGIFGSRTYACVVKFQDKYNLVTDGIVGKKTCSKLNSNLSYIVDSDNLNITDGKSIVVISKKANIRSGLGDNFSIIKKAKLGDVFSYMDIIIKNNVSWYKVKIGNNYGYIKKEVVSDNFIIVDISQQKLFYLNNEKIVLNTEVVTGTKGLHDTPVGHYNLKVVNKERSRTLRGKNDNGSSYASYVDYWMPFIMDRGIGFHDASWRSRDEFNDSTYIYAGSHGCINMQGNDAKKLYNSVKVDTDVVIRK